MAHCFPENIDKNKFVKKYKLNLVCRQNRSPKKLIRMKKISLDARGISMKLGTYSDLYALHFSPPHLQKTRQSINFKPL